MRSFRGRIAPRTDLASHPAGVDPRALTVTGTSRMDDPAHVRRQSGGELLPTWRPQEPAHAARPVGTETRPAAHRLAYTIHAGDGLRGDLTGAQGVIARRLTMSGAPGSSEPHGSQPTRPTPRGEPNAWLPAPSHGCAAPSARDRITGRARLASRMVDPLRVTPETAQLARRSEAAS